MTRELAHDLKITEQMKGLDVESKKILRHKEVLAVILKDTVSFYKFCNCRNIGRCIPNEENYDLMELVIIRLGEPEEECTQDVIEFLNLLFYPHKSDFKRKISRFIPGENEIMKEAEDMTGLGESIYAEGYEVGVSEGISQGIEQNIRILRELNISEDVIKEKIMETFQLSLKEAEKYLGR